MESIRNQPKIEREFFEDKNGKIKYKDYCMNCSNICKQSFKVISVQCKQKNIVHTPNEYLAEIENNKLELADIGKKIGINSRTLKSMLVGNRDMSFEAYIGLEELLFPDIKRRKAKKK